MTETHDETRPDTSPPEPTTLKSTTYLDPAVLTGSMEDLTDVVRRAVSAAVQSLRDQALDANLVAAPEASA